VGVRGDVGGEDIGELTSDAAGPLFKRPGEFGGDIDVEKSKSLFLLICLLL